MGEEWNCNPEPFIALYASFIFYHASEPVLRHWSALRELKNPGSLEDTLASESPWGVSPIFQLFHFHLLFCRAKKSPESLSKSISPNYSAPKFSLLDLRMQDGQDALE